jgi:hypothetical protein
MIIQNLIKSILFVVRKFVERLRRKTLNANYINKGNGCKQNNVSQNPPQPLILGYKKGYIIKWGGITSTINI